MHGTLFTAGSAMRAQEQRLNNAAHNLANVSTDGYKRQRIEFQDVAYQIARPVTLPTADNVQVPTGVQVGQGVRVAATVRDFREGDLRQTDGPLDVAIQGRGFFQVVQPNGQLAYTRDGSLKLDRTGRMVNSEGLPFDPQLVLPTDFTRITIDSDGTVAAQVPNQSQPVQVGQLNLVQFINPAGLEPLGRNLLAASAASGEPMTYKPGQNGAGTLTQGSIEMSNVRAVDELIEFIMTQRAFDTASRGVQAADQMLSTTANIR